VELERILRVLEDNEPKDPVLGRCISQFRVASSSESSAPNKVSHLVERRRTTRKRTTANELGTEAGMNRLANVDSATRMSRLATEGRRRCVWKSETRTAFLQMYEGGASFDQLAARFGLRVSQCMSKIKRERQAFRNAHGII
jgi:DNA-directed RNA polymerase specialized sigma24 family protein